MADIDERRVRGSAAPVRFASGLNIVAGLWLVASPWIYQAWVRDPNGAWNDVLVGAIVAVLATVRATGAWTAAWMSWVNALLGAWMILAPWTYGYATAGDRLWNSVVAGLVILALGTWSALASRDVEAEPR